MPKLTHIKGLKCRECGREYAATKIYVCEDCFGPLDVIYNYDSINIDKKELKDKPKTIWRYFELLPIENPSNIVDLGAGYTIMHRADTLAKTLGLKEVYVKDDTVNPTYSFKDRPAAVAVSKAVEFGSKAVGCASTGNLAAATAAHAAKAGLPCYIFIPNSTELNKIVQATAYGANIIAVKGTYDNANVLAAQAAEIYNWAFVNINVRPYYVEGSKTLAFETCEQMNWSPPDHAIVPVGSGALLGAIRRGFDEFKKLGLIENSKIRITGAQSHGCSPVADAFKSDSKEISPVEQPDTIAKSLAVGNPGDGVYALKNIRETGGVAESATNEEIVEAIKLLAKTEGIFTEPAGGVTIAVLKKLAESGLVSTDEKIVCYVTGNGLKTPESILEYVPKPVEIEPSLEALTTLSTLGGV